MIGLSQQQEVSLRRSLEKNLTASLGAVFSELTGHLLKQSFKKLQAKDHKVTKQQKTAHEIGKKFGTFLSAMDNIRHWWLLMDP